MKVIILQSGSAGNCLYVESRGAAILVDAGISARQLELRLARCGGDLAKVKAVIVSHGHRDHIGHAGVYHRRLRLPVFAPPASASWLAWQENFSPLAYAPGDRLEIEHLIVETVPTPHDAPDSVAFVVSDGHRRLGVFTDLGHPFPELDKAMATVDAVIIESNYDPQMLAEGPYPADLQARIRGPGGHLSNIEAAECVKRYYRQFQWICLAHLSQHNNTPEIACQTFRRIVPSRSPILAEYFSATEVPPLV